MVTWKGRLNQLNYCLFLEIWVIRLRVRLWLILWMPLMLIWMVESVSKSSWVWSVVELESQTQGRIVRKCSIWLMMIEMERLELVIYWESLRNWERCWLKKKSRKWSIELIMIKKIMSLLKISIMSSLEDHSYDVYYLFYQYYIL